MGIRVVAIARLAALDITVSSPGTLTFRWPDRVEVFTLQSAILKAIRHSSEIELLFYVRGESWIDGRQLTNAELSVFLPEFDPATLIGRRFDVPRSYDDTRQDHVSCVYYFEHHDLNRNMVEVLGQEDGRFRVRWSGTTADVNDDEDTADCVLIEAMFKLSFDDAAA